MWSDLLFSAEIAIFAERSLQTSWRLADLPFIPKSTVEADERTSESESFIIITIGFVDWEHGRRRPGAPSPWHQTGEANLSIDVYHDAVWCDPPFPGDPDQKQNLCGFQVLYKHETDCARTRRWTTRSIVLHAQRAAAQRAAALPRRARDITLGARSLPTCEFQQLPSQAFQHVIDKKLVFSTNAAVCFKLGLEQCFSKRYITKKELEYWRIKTAQVNMESAPWVTEMQAAIRTIQTQVKTLETNAQILKTHFEKLRLALIQKEEEEKQRERRQKIVSLLSLGLVFAGGPVIRELMNGVMDLADPVHLLSATLELAGTDEIAKFCATDGANVVFRADIDKLLERSDIAPMEFASVLKDAVVLEHPEFVADRNVAQSMNWGEENRGSATKQPEDPGYPPRAEVSASRYESPKLLAYGRQHGHDGGLRSRQKSDQDQRKEHHTQTLQDFEFQQLDEFPFHYAVQQSNGDVDDFLELLQFAEEEGHDVNQAHEVIVKAVGSTSEYKSMTLPPYMFASYLGYVDIVKHLIDRKDFKPMDEGERVVVTVNRARKAARAAKVA